MCRVVAHLVRASRRDRERLPSIELCLVTIHEHRRRAAEDEVQLTDVRVPMRTLGGSCGHAFEHHVQVGVSDERPCLASVSPGSMFGGVSIDHFDVLLEAAG